MAADFSAEALSIDADERVAGRAHEALEGLVRCFRA